MKNIHNPFVLALSASVLVACGGGGGSASMPAQSTAISAFKDISTPSSFNWTTTETAPTPTVQVSWSSSSTAPTGDLRVVISNFITVDPTGSGATIDPVSTDVIAWATATAVNGASINLGAVSFPAGTASVYLQAFDVGDGRELAHAIVAVSDFSAGVVSLTY